MSVASLQKSIEELQSEVQKEMQYCWNIILPIVEALLSPSLTVCNGKYTIEPNKVHGGISNCFKAGDYGGKVLNIDNCIEFISDFPQVLTAVQTLYVKKVIEGRWKDALEKYTPLLFEANL